MVAVTSRYIMRQRFPINTIPRRGGGKSYLFACCSTIPSPLPLSFRVLFSLSEGVFAARFPNKAHNYSPLLLLGTAEDWKLLRDNTEAIVRERCTQEWLSALLPLLDKLNFEYSKGLASQVGDEAFWTSMCKPMSGARTWSNGLMGGLIFSFLTMKTGTITSSLGKSFHAHSRHPHAFNRKTKKKGASSA